MSYILFIDDERYPVNNSYVVVRSSQEAIDYVSDNGLPSHICFDHDLGGDDTSMRFCHWLADYVMDNDLSLNGMSWSVHSQNPVGAKNIKEYMQALANHVNI